MTLGATFGPRRRYDGMACSILRIAAIVARDGGGLDGVTNAFAAIPVRFAAK